MFYGDGVAGSGFLVMRLLNERLLARIRLACDRQEIAWRAQRAFSRASGEREMKGYLRLAVLSRRVRISFFSRCIYLGGNRH